MAHNPLIHTTHGLVPASALEVKDVVTFEDNARVIATEWRKGDELVRRDVWVSILRGQSVGAEQGGV